MLRVLVVILVVLPGCSTPPSSPIAEAFFDRTPLRATVDTMPDGQNARAMYIRALQARSFGTVIGYKAGLTSEAAQAAFGVTEPVLGVLLEGMLVPNDTTLDANFGVRPRFEGDLLVRVGHASINTAATDGALAAALDAVIPFIELPDLLYAESVPITGPRLTAINVGARMGVTGSAIPLPRDTSAVALLANIQLTLMDRGDTLAVSSSTALLGHPINAVRWIRDQVRATGATLAEGQVLSLGSMTPLFVPEPGQSITGHYLIDGAASDVRLDFE